MAVEDAGGKVVGPAASVAEALKLLETSSLNGAILDFNLPDGDIVPVIECLVSKCVPFLIQTGVGVSASLAIRFPDLVVMIKPVIATVLVDRLTRIMEASDLHSQVAASRSL